MIREFSFEESFAKTQLPILSFKVDNKCVNFLLDSGSDLSHINFNVDLSAFAQNNKINTLVGIDGIAHKVGGKEIRFEKDGLKFSLDVLIGNYTDAFKVVEEQYGKELHGILGNDFLAKYKAIIDFVKFKVRLKTYKHDQRK